MLAKVLSHGKGMPYWVKYTFGTTEYKRRVGLVLMYDNAVEETLEKAFTGKVPVRLLIDPKRPWRHMVLPDDVTVTTNPSRAAEDGVKPRERANEA